MRNKLVCECEHKAHFDETEKTPNGNPGHLYGVVFSSSYYMREIKAPHGTFRICKDCAEDCLKDFIEESK